MHAQQHDNVCGYGYFIGASVRIAVAHPSLEQVRIAHSAGLALAASTMAGAMPQPQDPAAIAQVVTAFVRAQTQGLPGRVEVNQGGVDPRLS